MVGNLLLIRLHIEKINLNAIFRVGRKSGA